MMRAHAYPLLAAISSLSLVAISLLLVPGAVRDHRFNRCVDAQIQLRRGAGMQSQEGPGKLIELEALAHCQGR